MLKDQQRDSVRYHRRLDVHGDGQGQSIKPAPYGVRTRVRRSGLPSGPATGESDRLEYHQSSQCVHESPGERTTSVLAHVPRLRGQERHC